MLNNLIKNIQNNDSGDANNGKLSSTAMETLKLLANQVLELRTTVDEQSQMIKGLINEIKSLKQEQKNLEGDMNMVHIDQKDLSKQLKKIKFETAAAKEKYIEDEISDLYQATNGREPSFEEIAEHFYPNYKNNQMLQKQMQNQPQQRQQQQPQQAANYQFERKVETPDSMKDRMAAIKRNQDLLNHPAIKRNLAKPAQEIEEQVDAKFGRTPRFLK